MVKRNHTRADNVEWIIGKPFWRDAGRNDPLVDDDDPADLVAVHHIPTGLTLLADIQSVQADWEQLLVTGCFEPSAKDVHLGKAAPEILARAFQLLAEWFEDPGIVQGDEDDLGGVWLDDDINDAFDDD